MLAHISIPYGAIKRRTSDYVLYMIDGFQFLMVRLKGIIAVLKKIRVIISIPYGAIKSSYYVKFFVAEILFQFLMVRLKVLIFFILNISA